MAALLYRKAFILAAGLPFDYADDDQRKHVTNLSVNKHFEGHEGQVPCDLLEQYPELYKKIHALWRSVAEAASPFMRLQSSALHFEFFGLDVIADEDGECWLIEANRLPGLESSNNNKEQEDLFYNEMMLSLLRIVLRPLTINKSSDSESKHRSLEVNNSLASNISTSGSNNSVFEFDISSVPVKPAAVATTSVSTKTKTDDNDDCTAKNCTATTADTLSSMDALNEEHSQIRGGWEFVKGPSRSSAQDCQASSESLPINLLNWVAFTRRNKQSIMAVHNC